MSFTRPPRVHGGNRQQIRAEHHNALVRCIEELQDARLPVTINNRKAIRGGRYHVSFSAGTQKLHVGEGSVAWSVTGQPDSVTRPYIPKLDGVSLTERPGWNVSGKSVEVEYEVICLYSSTAGRMVLHEKDGEEELEIEEGERARLIATVIFENATSGPGLKIQELTQRWRDDIEHEGGDYGSSFSSASDGDDSEESGDSGIEDSTGSGDEDSDSDSSSSGSSCCPEITLYPTLIDTGDPSGCLGVDGPGMASRVTFYVQGIVGNYSCPECSDVNLYVEFGIGGQKQAKFLGRDGGGQEFAGWFEVFVLPCSRATAWACIRAFGASVVGNDCVIAENCCSYQTVNVPGPCPDGECSEDSDSSSSSSSDAPSIPCNNDARLTNKVVLSPNSGRFTIENHGTCSVFVNRIYPEGSIVSWNFTPDPNVTEVEVLPGHGHNFVLAAASGDPGSISGTVVEVGYHYEGEATQLVQFVF